MNPRQLLQTISAATATGLLGAAKPSSPPNIVFLYVDDLGHGNVSFYGATFEATPLSSSTPTSSPCPPC